MKKYTVEELMDMKSDDIRKLSDKNWAVTDFLRSQRGLENALSTKNGELEYKPSWSMFDTRQVLSATLPGLLISGAMVATGYLMYRGVKYYTDSKRKEEVNVEL